MSNSKYFFTFDPSKYNIYNNYIQLSATKQPQSLGLKIILCYNNVQMFVNK